MYCFRHYPETYVHAPISAGVISVLNTFVLGGPLTYGIYTSAALSTGVLTIGDCVCMLLKLLVFVHVWFYATHRLLHTAFLFRHVHYIHHMYNHTNAYCAQFAHPVEFVVGNLAGVIIAPLFCTVHRLVFVPWVLVCLNQSILAHGLPSTYHSDHHRLYHLHYGINWYMDTMFGTRRETSTLVGTRITDVYPVT